MSRAPVAVMGILLVSLAGAAHAQTTNFVTQEQADSWRASKLSGVAIFGPDNKKVGSVTDILMDHDGKASAIVIGVGGFLGLGQKDVAVPFDQVKFSDQPMAGSRQSMAEPGSVSAAPMNGAASPAITALGLPADTTGNSNASIGNGAGQSTAGLGTNGAPSAGAPAALGGPTASMNGSAVSAAEVVRSTSYPDHGTIDLTSDQLKAAPSFQFAK